MKIAIVIALMLVLSGCGTTKHSIGFDEYQTKVMMCEHLGMRVHVVNTIRNGVPEVKEVVCYDKHGASWNTQQMRNQED